MRITNVAIQNWRNFKEVDVPLTERVFLIGPNASGKSNFLDVFRFLRDIAKSGGGLQKSVLEDRGGLTKIRCLAARRNPDVEIRVELSGSGGKEQHTWCYSLGLKQEPRGKGPVLVTHECVWRDGKQILARPDMEDQEDEARLTQTHLEQVSANKEFRAVADYFSNIHYLHLVPQVMRHPEDFGGADVPNDPFGRAFIRRIVDTHKTTVQARLKKIQEALRTAVPQLKSLQVTTDKRGIPHLEAVYEHWRPKGAWQQEDQFSDGTLRLLGLLWSLLDGKSLLLLEEPELSLHPAIVKDIPALIAGVQRTQGRQVIVSSHSPELFNDRGIAGEEVLLLFPDSEGTQIEPASSFEDVRALLDEGFTIADAALRKPECASMRNRQMLLF